MESLYYVTTFLCHRTCHHCYEDRFRPYYGAERERVVEESVANHARIIENFPDRMTYLDLHDCDPQTGRPREKIGRVILAGGEILLDPVRERVLYSALDMLHQKYSDEVKLIVQTTGDLVTEKIVEELLSHHVWQISVSGIDNHHDGLETKVARENLVAKLTRIFDSRGMELKPLVAESAELADMEGRYFSFFGETEESLIGQLWPSGRAQQIDKSNANHRD